jgi:hypothetical protein
MIVDRLPGSRGSETHSEPRAPASGWSILTAKMLWIYCMPDITPETLLRNLAARRSLEVLALGCRIRDIVRRAVPDAKEVVYHGALCYGRGATRSRLEVYISFHSSHVNLGFYRGAHLTDPDGLLCGDGKQMRHIKVGSVADLKPVVFRRLVRAALTE